MEKLIFSYEIEVAVSDQRFIRKGIMVDETLVEATKTICEIYGEDNIFEMKLTFVGGAKGIEQQNLFVLESIEKKRY